VAVADVEDLQLGPRCNERCLPLYTIGYSDTSTATGDHL